MDGSGSTSKVRVLNNMTNDRLAVDVYLDGERVLTRVKYRDISEYLTVPGGSHTIGLEPVTSSISVERTEESITLSPGHAYTVVAYGIPDREMKYGPVRGMQLLLLEDTQTYTENRKAQLRFLHSTVNVPAVDLYVSGKLALRGLQSGSFGYLSLPPGITELVVTGAESNEVDSRNLGSFSVNLEAGRMYTITTSGSYPLDGLLLPQ